MKMRTLLLSVLYCSALNANTMAVTSGGGLITSFIELLTLNQKQLFASQIALEAQLAYLSAIAMPGENVQVDIGQVTALLAFINYIKWTAPLAPVRDEALVSEPPLPTVTVSSPITEQAPNHF